MSRPPKWTHDVNASRSEALTAIALHNSPLSPRPLESFLVHMHMAWLYLLHAEFQRDGTPYHFRNRNNGRYVKVDGERKSFDLENCLKVRWPDSQDPVRANLEITVQLRNKIEHRYEKGLRVASAGFAQALVVNYESELMTQFGTENSLADRVHLPVSLSTFSREGAAAMVRAQMELPERLRDFFVNFRAALSDEVLDDRAFEFRIEIVQKRAPKTEADLAIDFVNMDGLEDDEIAAYEQLAKTGRVILRDKVREVGDAGWMLPGKASAKVESRIGYKFSPSSDFARAWKHFKVRPATGAPDSQRTKTDPRYCRWNSAFGGYVYSSAFIDKVCEACRTPEGFKQVIGRDPRSLT
jgi:hypothetical protein